MSPCMIAIAGVGIVAVLVVLCGLLLGDDPVALPRPRRPGEAARRHRR